MTWVEWLVIGGCNVLLIGVGLLVYSGKLDDVLTGNMSKSVLERKRIDLSSYHRWGMIVCVATALLLDAAVVFLMK